jgi:GAF domain-containing protein
MAGGWASLARVKPSERARRVPLGAEIALAFVGAIAFFALVAVTVAAVESDVAVAALGVVFIAAVVAIARLIGVVYAIPAAIAGLVAYDWFQFPPTHPHEFPGSEDLGELLAWLAVAVLIGELAERAGRRADVSEAARSELAEEQAALRRVATLVARGVSPDEVFAAVAEEVGALLRVDGARAVRFDGDEEVTLLAGWRAPGYGPLPEGRTKLDGRSVTSEVLRTGRVVRIDDYADVSGTLPHMAQLVGAQSAVGAPIVVDGRLWGTMLAWQMHPEPLPASAEARLAAFTELIATAVSNTAGREQLARLADEQAALRRVATLVAREPSPELVFAAVAREIGELLGVDATHMGRYEPDGTAVGLASWSRTGASIPVGTRAPVEGDSVTAIVQRTGRSARVDTYDDVSGEVAEMLRVLDIRSSVGAPIIVNEQLWGVMIASSKADQLLPADTESRIAAFTELVATAISNTEARAQLGSLADEQAALRRVATLVARGLPYGDLFGAVTEEVGRLLGADVARMIRYEADDGVSALGTWAAEGQPVGGPWPREGASLTPRIAETGQPSRIDDWADVPGPVAELVRTKLGLRSSVGCPIVFEGGVWGALTVHSRQARPFPRDTESRLTNFTELVATAVSNADARAEVDRLAEQQAALRRVATLVARESQAADVFAAIAEEMGQLLGVEDMRTIRYHDDGTATVMGSWGELAAEIPAESRWPVEGDTIISRVARTGLPARVDDYGESTGPVADYARSLGVRSAVGAPILVEGRVWGAMIAASLQPEPLPVEAESRLVEFTELMATAISNIEARSELAASRARIVAATDDERRRVVRDLHDGAQQRLIQTVVTLKLARSAVQDEDEEAPELLSEALEHAERATAELRELAHGILPSVLIRGGLRAGVDALASRTPVPVENGVSVGRLPPEVEATAYFVVAEALTNVAKHSGAEHATVTAWLDDGALAVQVRDDGVGGARLDGSGLLGLADRLAVLDGRLRVETPAEGGTLVAAVIPLAAGYVPRTSGGADPAGTST